MNICKKTGVKFIFEYVFGGLLLPSWYQSTTVLSPPPSGRLDRCWSPFPHDFLCETKVSGRPDVDFSPTGLVRRLFRRRVSFRTSTRSRRRPGPQILGQWLSRPYSSNSSQRLSRFQKTRKLCTIILLRLRLHSILFLFIWIVVGATGHPQEEGP